MTAKIYGTLLFILGFTTGFAQVPGVSQTQFGVVNTLPEEQCAQHEIHERMMAQNPEYRSEQLAREVQLDHLVRQYKMGLIPKDNAIFTIPIVVHVIHDGDAYGTGSNITDEQIYSAINGLNQDFRKMAGTAGDGAGSDIEIEFCLAQRDPQGNPTTGITRTSGCSLPDYCAEGITAGNGQGADESDVKNLSRWPNQEYYNIWVVTEIEGNNGGSGIQGYAYFPTTSQVDGIVLLYNAFGTTGNLKSYTNMNRTVTHEMGHALALFHTFQGGTCAETNCEWQGDRVCDTPPTVLNSSCSNPACGGTQQVENYMDYTSEGCKNMFTEGQKIRMRLALQNSRENLLNSNACVPVTTILADAAVTAISKPTGNTCTNMIQPVIEITNQGSNILANAAIKYHTSAAWQTYNWTGLLGPGQSVTVTLPLFDGGWNDKTLAVKTALPNGEADANPANDSFSIDYHSVQNGHTLTLNITKDVLGGQTTWLIRNGAGETLDSGGPYPNFQSGTVETETFCVENGCYDFILFDLGGNGICCESGNGSYELLDENNNVLASGGSFGNQDLTNFCFEAGGDLPSADFSAANTSLCEGGSTTFTNLTTGDVDSYSWKFFGGTPFTASGSNPGTITYDSPGTYKVRLAATNQYGEDVEVKTNYITVGEIQTWYADSDGDGHGNPAATMTSCVQPDGYVAAGDDCNDSNSNDWNSCYDCLDVMNGTAVLDNCGECDSNPANDCTQDCLGTWGGDAVMDNCGVCDTNPANDCTQDCLGAWGGDAVMDNCGVCDTNPANDCTQDCLGAWGGDAVMDNCGVCDTNPANDCTQDCLGTWGGDAVMDNCGVCDANSANDCAQDCAGVWGGDSYYDDCGTCDSDSANDCIPCDNLQLNVVTAVEPTCHGGTDGSITIEVVNALGDYTIDWNTGAHSETISNLAAGNYTVTVYQDDCIAFLEIVLGQPNELVIAVDNIVYDDCTVSNTGAADITITGGTAPYTVSVNTEIVANLNLTELAQDSYNVFVTDAHSCTATYAFEIGEISCDSLPLTNISAALCETGSIGFFENVTCLPVANATSYAWEIRKEDNANPPITFTTTEPWFIADGVADIMPNTVYAIRVKGINPTIPGSFGLECTLQFKIGTSALLVGDCDNNGLFMTDLVHNSAIEGATQYEFRFEEISSGERTYFYSFTESCALQEVDTLKLNTPYAVTIRGKYRNTWGDYGNVCSIEIKPDIETTALTEPFCNNLYINPNLDQILVQPIENATVYELRISDSNETNAVVIQNSQPTFPILSIPGVVQNHTYTAQARALINGDWTPWGESCNIAFKDLNTLKLNVVIYPNPVRMGRQINMQTKKDWENMRIHICDAYGRPMIRINRDFERRVPQILDISTFRTGMYFVTFTHGKQRLSKKFVIN